MGAAGIDWCIKNYIVMKCYLSNTMAELVVLHSCGMLCFMKAKIVFLIFR